MKLIIDIPEQTYKKIMMCIVGTEDTITVRSAIRHGEKLETVKKKIDEQSNMHLDGEFYIKSFDVKRILDKPI